MTAARLVLRRVAAVVVYVAALVVGVILVPSWPAWGRALYVGLCVGVILGGAATEYWHRRSRPME